MTDETEVLPASAGMILVYIVPPSDFQCAPRIRGDDPHH